MCAQTIILAAHKVMCGKKRSQKKIYWCYVVQEGGKLNFIENLYWDRVFVFVNQEILTNGYFFTCIFVGLKLSLAVFPPLKTALITSNFHNPCQIIILYILATLFKRIKPRFQCVRCCVLTDSVRVRVHVFIPSSY